MLGLLEQTDPNVAQRGDISVADLLRDGAQRARIELREQPQVQGELLLTIAGLQYRFGRFEDALTLLDAVPSSDARLALRVALERARVLLALGREAECMQVVESLEAAVVPDGPGAQEAARWCENAGAVGKARIGKPD